MLDAFGKGASEEIREAKHVLYTQMTWDPEKAAALYPGLPQLAIPAALSAPPSAPASPSLSHAASSQGA